MYQLRKTLFDKRDSFNIPYSDDQKLFKNLAIFVFDYFCVQEDKFRKTDVTTRIGKHSPISVSLSFNMIEQPMLFCHSNTGALVESFVDGLEAESKVRMELKFLEIETSVKTKLNQIFSALNQRRCREEPVLKFENECTEEEQDALRQFLQTKESTH